MSIRIYKFFMKKLYQIISDYTYDLHVIREDFSPIFLPYAKII